MLRNRGRQDLQGRRDPQGLQGPIGQQAPRVQLVQPEAKLGTPILRKPRNSANVARFTPANDIVLTRIEADAVIPPSGCTNDIVLQVSDGTAAGTKTLVLAADENDSGPLSVNYSAGSTLRLSVVPPSGCDHACIFDQCCNSIPCSLTQREHRITWCSLSPFKGNTNWLIALPSHVFAFF
jgi:hypothetical protein